MATLRSVLNNIEDISDNIWEFLGARLPIKTPDALRCYRLPARARCYMLDRFMLQQNFQTLRQLRAQAEIDEQICDNHSSISDDSDIWTHPPPSEPHRTEDLEEVEYLISIDVLPREMSVLQWIFSTPEVQWSPLSQWSPLTPDSVGELSDD